MTISSVYRKLLEEEVVKDNLKKGNIITKQELDKEVDDIVSSNPDLDKPFTQESLYYVSESEKSSSLKMNDIFKWTVNDLRVCYTTLTDSASDITNIYDSVSSELKTIEKKIESLEYKTSNLILISENIEGYWDFVYDDFDTKEKIDIDNSTVGIDNSVGAVMLPILKQERLVLEPEESDIQFNIVTREQFKSSILSPGSSLLNAFSDQNTIWSHKVYMTRGVDSVITELIIRVPQSNVEVTKIVYSPSSSDEGDITTVTPQYSDDGINWFNVDGEDTKRLIGDVSMLFQPVTASYWKLIFTKAGFDEFINNSYVYEFGAKFVQFYGIDYFEQARSSTATLTSIALTSESTQELNRISIKTCEVAPINTEITYSIAGLTESELQDYNDEIITLDDLNFLAIDPIDKDEKVNQTVIDFSKIDTIDGIDSF